MLQIEKMEILNKRIIDFHLDAGEIVQLKGSNGSGKSLFLKSISRLIPSTFSNLSLMSKDHTHFSLEEWRRKIIYLPHLIHEDLEQSVEEYLLAPLKFNIYSDFKMDQEYFSLIKNLETPLKKLSTGERQQVMILRALSLKPQILLLDETLSNLDQIKREQIFNVLKSWTGNVRSIVVVSHFDLTHQVSRNYCL